MRLWIAACATLCLAVIAGTTTIDAVDPVPEIKVAGPEAAERERARRSRTLLDGSAAQWIETELKFRSRIRRRFAPYWLAGLLKYGKSAPPTLIVGKDDWLFFRHLTKFGGRSRFEYAQSPGRLLGFYRRRLAAVGTDLAVVPLPRRVAAARDKVPPGVDTYPEYEAELIDGLRSNGVTTVDLLDVGADLSAEEFFQPLDPHWALGAQRATAQEVARLFPHHVGNPAGIEVEPQRRLSEVGITMRFGLYNVHPAFNLILGKPRLASVRLTPQASRTIGEARKSDYHVALVGTSHSADYSLPALLTEAFQRPTHVWAYKAMRFGQSLSRFLASAKDLGYPKLLVYEFPSRRPMAWVTRAGSTINHVGKVLELLPSAGFSPVPASEKMFARPKGKARPIRLAIEDGWLLSSGDGTIAVELSIRMKRAGRIRVDSYGCSTLHDLESGKHTMIVPIIDTERGKGTLRVTGLDPGGREAEVNARAVTDANFAAATPIPMNSTSNRPGGTIVHKSKLEVPVRPFDVLALRWLGRPEEVSARIVGVDRRGENVTIDWRYDRTKSSLLLHSLGPLEGGRITEVELTGARRGVECAVLAKGW